MKKSKYKLVNEIKEEEDSSINIPRMIFEYGLLAIICIFTFLVAKYIVTNNIEGEKSPVDTSERL